MRLLVFITALLSIVHAEQIPNGLNSITTCDGKPSPLLRIDSWSVEGKIKVGSTLKVHLKGEYFKTVDITKADVEVKFSFFPWTKVPYNFPEPVHAVKGPVDETFIYVIPNLIPIPLSVKFEAKVTSKDSKGTAYGCFRLKGRTDSIDVPKVSNE